MGRCVHEADEKWGGESKGADEKWGGESVTPFSQALFVINCDISFVFYPTVFRRRYVLQLFEYYNWRYVLQLFILTKN